MNMESIRLSDQSKYDAGDCVICNKRIDLKPTTGEKGRKNILLAAEQKKDAVYLRLLSLKDRSNFNYHMNNKCYGSYTKICTTTVEKSSTNVAAESSVDNDVPVESDTDVDHVEKESVEKVSRITRSQNIVYSSKKSAKAIETVCVICDKVKVGNEIFKACMSNLNRAEHFLKITRTLKDKVYERTAHLQSPESVISAQVFFHVNCLRAYEIKFERQAENRQQQTISNDDRSDYNVTCNDDLLGSTSSNSNSNNWQLTKEYIESIQHRIIAGEAFELSSLTKEIKNEHGFEENFNNKFVKKVLIEHFGENIAFSYPKQKNKSVMIFYAKLSVSDMVNTMRSPSKFKSCAKDLRNIMKDIDFDLKNKYCDEHDLRLSWNNFKLPKEFIEFFSEFYNIDEVRLGLEKDKIDENDKFDLKVLKIICLFQTMYYILHDGRGRTPLHVTTGISIHHVSKSKAIITYLNRLGLSISYAEVERFKVGLAAYTARSAEILTPLPSHFDPRVFTTAAFDNFDFESYSLSGLKGTHDTVSVLFQEKTNSRHSNKSDNFQNSDHSMKVLSKPLKCQMKKDFSQLRKGIYLPNAYTASTSGTLVTTESFKRIFESDHLAWYLCRMSSNGNFLCTSNAQQIIPSYPAFQSLFENDNRPCAQVGFCVVLPHKVTEADVVYTAERNFVEILSQLDQKYLPVTCDEGVYKLACPIRFAKYEELKHLFIMLGAFHNEKVTYSCIGKYLEESGIENVLVETNLFGKIVVEQMLSGAHYSRAVKGYFIIGEALTRLQLQSFLTKERIAEYHVELEILQNFENAIAEDSFDEAKILLALFSQYSHKLKLDLEEFIQKRCQESPLYRYFNNVLIMIDIAQNSHKADRRGDWKLHVDAQKKQQPLYFALDRIHYARYGPIYLEDCLNLERDMPEVYNEFMKGAFTVKQTTKPCSSVATDQALEQTCNKIGKGKSGKVGFTTDKSACAVWDMTFHECAGINNFYQEIIGLDDDKDELKVHHEFTSASAQSIEDAVNIVVQYLLQRVNPFQEGCQPLRNIVTNELVDEKAADKLLNVFKIGCDKFNEFRRDRIVEKNVPLSETIHHTKLPNFKTVYKDIPKNPAIKKKDVLHQSLRIIDIARERNYSIKDLLCYEISPMNTLFDENGLIKKEKNKSELTLILEKHLDPETDYVISNSSMGTIVDVMLYCRKVSWKNLKNFADFANVFCSLIKSNTFHGTVQRIDFIFDDYFELSPKSSERIRRSNGDFIELFEITSDTPLPTQADKFWSSEKNKEMLQVFLRNYIFVRHTELWPHVELVFSTLKMYECVSTTSHLRSDPTMSSLQRFDIEEADTKIMLHINDCCTQGIKSILLLSSDTDIVVLALNFWNFFSAKGLQELWMKIGAAAKVRNLPIHKLATKMGPIKCQTIVAAHHLTGADYTSKVGTKLSSQRAEPEKYLLNFGRGSSELFTNSCIEMGEKYLVSVYKKDSGCQDFDSLRYADYHHASNCDLSQLPPTSAQIKEHILRAYFITYQQVNVLDENTVKIDPLYTDMRSKQIC